MMMLEAMQTLPAYPCFLGAGSQGQFTTIDKAQVSVMDRGFIFGDGIYEVFTVYDGHPFRFAQHMARLERSLAEMRMANPYTRSQWLALVQQLVAIKTIATTQGNVPGSGPFSSENALIYLQLTRGVALRDHAMTEGLPPTVFMMRTPLKQPSPEQRSRGVACVSADDFRWQKAHIKSTSLLGAVFARQISADVGAAETVMFREGHLSEASSSNVWVVKNGQVLGVPKDHLVLEGIRYGLIEELCKACGLAFALRRISQQEVLQADELLLSSATKEVLPITQLDGQRVGSGQPGPVYAKLYAAYQAAIAAERASQVTRDAATIKP
jgi:D-alanine transaminase